MSESDTPTNLARGPKASTAVAGAPHQRAGKRPPSPGRDDDDSRAYKSQRSVSDEIGPGIRQFCRLDSDPKSGQSRVWKNPVSAGDKVDEAVTGVAGPGEEEVGQGNNPPMDPVPNFAEPRCSQKSQQPLGSGVDLVDGLFTDLVEAGKKKARKFVGKVVERFRVVLPQSSLEPHPNNNVHVPHPDKLNNGMLGLGMHIQKNENGHLVRSVIPEGFAAKSELKENDVIVDVNGNDVTSWEFNTLQEFFGNLEEVDFEIVVERQNEDETDAPVCQVTIHINLSIEGSLVIVNVEVKEHVQRCEYLRESNPFYIFQNQSGNTKFLTLKNNSFVMSTVNDFTPCRFKRFYYTYGLIGAVVNLNNGLPLDHCEISRIAKNSDGLTGKIDNIWGDNRIFFIKRQNNTKLITFQAASKKGRYLTADEKGNLTTTCYSDIEAVGLEGLFNMEVTSKVDKLSPSHLQKLNPKN